MCYSLHYKINSVSARKPSISITKQTKTGDARGSITVLESTVHSL
jgi:hypothetical protein